MLDLHIPPSGCRRLLGLIRKVTVVIAISIGGVMTRLFRDTNLINCQQATIYDLLARLGRKPIFKRASSFRSFNPSNDRTN